MSVRVRMSMRVRGWVVWVRVGRVLGVLGIRVRVLLVRVWGMLRVRVLVRVLRMLRMLGLGVRVLCRRKHMRRTRGTRPMRMCMCMGRTRRVRLRSSRMCVRRRDTCGRARMLRRDWDRHGAGQPTATYTSTRAHSSSGAWGMRIHKHAFRVLARASARGFGGGGGGFCGCSSRRGNCRGWGCGRRDIRGRRGIWRCRQHTRTHTCVCTRRFGEARGRDAYTRGPHSFPLTAPLLGRHCAAFCLPSIRGSASAIGGRQPQCPQWPVHALDAMCTGHVARGAWVGQVVHDGVV